MAKPYLIEKHNDSSLVLIKSRKYELIELGVLLGFCTFWYSTQIYVADGVAGLLKKIESRDLFTLTFVGAPLLGLPKLIGSLKNCIKPRTLIFDLERKKIFESGKEIASFDEVGQVQIKTIKDSDGPDEFALALKLSNNRKVRIAQSKNYEDIFEIADEMAEVMRKNIEKTK